MLFTKIKCIRFTVAQRFTEIGGFLWWKTEVFQFRLRKSVDQNVVRMIDVWKVVDVIAHLSWFQVIVSQGHGET